MLEKLIANIKKNEGFRATVYKDTEGYDTIGYGTKMPLNEDEAELILKHRLKAKIKELESKKPLVNSLPVEKQSILAEMCYQMGVNGVLKFKKMWKALEISNYETASVEMLDSRWAKQTPSRAKKLADVMREI